MAKLVRLDGVGIFTRNQKLSKDFYTRKIGLKVRSTMPDVGYLSLGATKGGQDAGLELWQPDPKWGEEMYRQNLAQVGIVTGIGFSTGNFEKTVQNLSKAGVKIEKEQEGFARFWDPDGNALFLTGQARSKVRRAGVQKLEFVTVASRDAARTGAFYTKTLGLKGKTERGDDRMERLTFYRLAPAQTSIMPFTPTREMYDNAADYETDVAHIGEDTSIGFLADDTYALQAKLLAKGVEFAANAEKQEWGGVRARILDPDGNRYMVYHMER